MLESLNLVYIRTLKSLFVGLRMDLTAPFSSLSILSVFPRSVCVMFCKKCTKYNLQTCYTYGA